MLDKPRWQERAIPIILHGDGVNYGGAHGDTVMVVQWSMLLSKIHTWQSHFLVTAVPKRCRTHLRLDGSDTMHDIWAAIADDLNDCFHGHLKDGTPIMDGKWFAVVWCVCADYEFFANELHMPHWGNAEPCWLCRANKGDRNWRDVRPDAAWRATTHTCLQTSPSIKPHPIWRIAGLHRHFCPGDAMHCLDCGGVASHLIASVLWELLMESARRVDGQGAFTGTIEQK